MPSGSSPGAAPSSPRRAKLQSESVLRKHAEDALAAVRTNVHYVDGRLPRCWPMSMTASRCATTTSRFAAGWARRASRSMAGPRPRSSAPRGWTSRHPRARRSRAMSPSRRAARRSRAGAVPARPCAVPAALRRPGPRAGRLRPADRRDGPDGRPRGARGREPGRARPGPVCRHPRDGTHRLGQRGRPAARCPGRRRILPLTRSRSRCRSSPRARPSTSCSCAFARRRKT